MSNSNDASYFGRRKPPRDGGVQVTAMETRTPDFAKRLLPVRKAK